VGARQESPLRERRGGRDRLRAEGGGPNHRLPFTGRVIATLVIMRFQLPHAAWQAGEAEGNTPTLVLVVDISMTYRHCRLLI
jgi:hypothetical protein